MAAAHLQMLQAVICDAGRMDELLDAAPQRQPCQNCAEVAGTIAVCAAQCPAAVESPLWELLRQTVMNMCPAVRGGQGESSSLLSCSSVMVNLNPHVQALPQAPSQHESALWASMRAVIVQAAAGSPRLTTHLLADFVMDEVMTQLVLAQFDGTALGGRAMVVNSNSNVSH